MGTPADRDQAVGVDGAGAAATQVGTCQWRTVLGEYSCNQPVNRATFNHFALCIFHAPPESKSSSQFNLALDEKIRREEADDAITFDGQVNLAGVVFPADANFTGRVFNKAVTFAEAQFSGEVSFLGARFEGAADFGGTHFGGEASFPVSHFAGNAVFVGAQFGGETNFREARFSRTADFGGAQFGGMGYFGGAHFGGPASFIRTQFPPQESEAVVRFVSLAPESARSLRLEGVDLSRVSFLRSDVSKIQFVDCTWAKMPNYPLLPLLPFPAGYLTQHRTVIYDAVALDGPGKGEVLAENRRLVTEQYRQLRLNYEASRQEAEAGHFYVGQMEMRRQDITYLWLYRWMLVMYRVLAMYGESYLRPSFFYFTLGLLFGLAYLWGGFQVGQAAIKYDPGTFAWGQAGAFGKDFFRAYFSHALTAGGILGANPLGAQFGASLETTSWWVPAVRYVNMLLDTFLVGFFVIALRRHFHR